MIRGQLFNLLQKDFKIHSRLKIIKNFYGIIFNKIPKDNLFISSTSYSQHVKLCSFWSKLLRSYLKWEYIFVGKYYPTLVTLYTSN